MSQMLSKFMIVDGNALLHRAWHALPQTMKSASGQITNAAYGFTSILLKAIKDLRPTYLVVCFDAPGPTFRDKLYQDYKAKRIKKPQDLYDQIPIIQEILDAFRIKHYQIARVEADDVIGTIVASLLKSKDQGSKIIIVTGDLDTLQLLNDSVLVYTLKKGITETLIYDITEVKKRYNSLEPEQLVDFKALRGDPSDNIPGANGIGEKTAIELLIKFNTVNELLKQVKASKIPELAKQTGIREAVFKKVLESTKEIKLSQKLAQIKQDVKLTFTVDQALFGKFNSQAIMQIFQKYGFRSLIPQIQNLGDLYNQNVQINQREDHSGYVLVNNNNQIEQLLNKLKQQSAIAIDVETDGLDIISSKPIGISFCWQKGKAYYVDIKKFKIRKSKLEQVLEDSEIKKIGHNLKFDYQVLLSVGITVKNLYFDTMIASYLINPGQRTYSLDGLAFQYFGKTMQKIEKLIGPKGSQGQLNMGQVDPKKVAQYAAEDADFTWQLYQKLKLEIRKRNLFEVFFKIEMPLVKILACMERTGIKLDNQLLNKLSVQVSRRLRIVEQNIYKLAGSQFNIASPLQLKEVLFNQLKIETKGLKKTKTGISTAALELEKLRGKHPIIDQIFDYRELAKLQSTYIDALPNLVHPKTKRIHTSFNQVITTTGRLSSSNPNMQNIPIRTDLGREIRRAFVSESDYQLLSLDYSQIDLRMAAHLSGDKKMIETFQKDQDIHTATAASLFGVKMSQVSSDERRKAKEANFGVLYGLGARGLAQRMRVGLTEAQDFIDRYQTLYPQVFAFLEQVILETRKKGYAETLYGRRRYLPEINSGSPVVRAAAERAAINMPVQGTAADIIKIAMVKISAQGAVNSEPGAEIRMLLQVHDELVFEVKKGRVAYWARIIKREMENAAKLKVPLKVEAKVGNNWKEMEEIS